MSIQDEIGALKATLVREVNKEQPITVAQALQLVNIISQLGGLTLQDVCDNDNTAESISISGVLGLSVDGVSFTSNQLNDVGLLANEPLTPNANIVLYLNGTPYRVAAQIIP